MTNEDNNSESDDWRHRRYDFFQPSPDGSPQDHCRRGAANREEIATAVKHRRDAHEEVSSRAEENSDSTYTSVGTSGSSAPPDQCFALVSDCHCKICEAEADEGGFMWG